VVVAVDDTLEPASRPSAVVSLGKLGRVESTDSTSGEQGAKFTDLTGGDYRGLGRYSLLTVTTGGGRTQFPGCTSRIADAGSAFGRRPSGSSAHRSGGTCQSS
jgi:hypothetical protein